MTEVEHDTEELVELWIGWIRDRSLNDLVSRVDLTAIGREVAKDQASRDRVRRLYGVLWDWIRDELDAEERTVRNILGEEFSAQMVEVAANTPPDEETARILFRNPAAEAMFGNVLYEGISEFLSRGDIIGQILDKIPLIGGIKGKIESNIPEGTQGLVEGQIKNFLGNFSGAACEKGMNVVLSPDHVDDVQMVQAEVVRHFLDQPVNSYVPDSEASEQWKEAVWSGIENQLEDVEELMDRLDRFYNSMNTLALKEVVPEELPQTVRKLYASIIEEFLSDDAVQEWFDSHLDDIRG